MPESVSEYAGPVANVSPRAFRPLDIAPGQVAVLHSEVLHRSGPNRTATDRLAYLCGMVWATTRFLDDGVEADSKVPIFRSSQANDEE